MSFYEMNLWRWMVTPVNPVLPLAGHWSVLETRLGQSSSESCACRCPRCGDVH